MDHDEEMEPLYGMRGSMAAKFEVQQTMKRAEPTAFISVSTGLLDPSKFMWTTKEFQMDSREVERKRTDPNTGDADLGMKV